MTSPLIVEITALSHEGRGIAHVDGKTVFIEGALPGEQVTFTLTKKHRHYDEGRVLEIVQASPQRVVPRCPHFGVCGGCSQQNFSHELQIQHKQQILLDSLLHVGKVVPKTILPPMLGPIWGYRHKARLGVKFVEKKGKVLVGFREKQGRYLADLQSCDVLHPSIGKKIIALSKLVESLEKYKVIAQIEVAVSDDEVALVFRNLEALPESDLTKLRDFAQLHEFRIYLQPGGVESVFCLWPENPGPLLYTLPDFNLSLAFEPLDFTQINPVINRQLVSLAIKLLDLKSTDRVIDYFCGIGNFTLAMATVAAHVVGVEGADQAIIRARGNAERNHISNTTFYTSNLMGDLTNLPWRGDYDKILLDPPRSGAIELIEQLSFKAKKIVYVSCNPATLARDAAALVQNHGYKLKAAGIMDMFPHTSHVESIAVFES